MNCIKLIFLLYLLLLLHTVSATSFRSNSRSNSILKSRNRTSTATATTDTWCETGVVKKDLCCPTQCESCGPCLKNTTEYNNAINTQCCGTYIRQHYVLCNFTLPPCVIFANGTYIVQDNNNLFDELWFLILLGVSAGAATLLVFVCVWFPKERQPDIPYEGIILKFD